MVVEVSRIASDQQCQESVQKFKRSQKMSVESQEMLGNAPIFNKILNHVADQAWTNPRGTTYFSVQYLVHFLFLVS